MVRPLSACSTRPATTRSRAWGLPGPITLTATVAVVAPGAGAPDGSVTFLDGSTTLGSAALSGGVAIFTTTALPVGTRAITAVYGGGLDFQASQSLGRSQTVLAFAA